MAAGQFRTPFVLLVFSVLAIAPPICSAEILFQEGFEDAKLSSRGWYDNTSPRLSATEHVANSAQSLEFHFAKGAIIPDNGTGMRRKFPETDAVYLSYYVKYSSNWTGSNVAYHPHEFYFLTNKDGDWTGPAYTHLTLYVEQNEGKPQVGIQDGVNVDLANIGRDLTGVTENRGVAGCNGDSDGYGPGDCYPSGSTYVNGKMWKSPSILFSDTQGSYYKNDWHKIEVYVKLNTISNGKAVKDGILQYWLDGTPVLDHKNVVFRTAQNSEMKFNQFIIGPYIGVGSPVDQAFWIDSLSLATGPSGELSPPSNLRIIGN